MRARPGVAGGHREPGGDSMVIWSTIRDGRSADWMVNQ
jgi:hypothetical protein